MQLAALDSIDIELGSMEDVLGCPSPALSDSTHIGEDLSWMDIDMCNTKQSLDFETDLSSEKHFMSKKRKLNATELSFDVLPLDVDSDFGTPDVFGAINIDTDLEHVSAFLDKPVERMAKRQALEDDDEDESPRALSRDNSSCTEEDSKLSRRQRNAMACRKHRAKRKREAEDLREKNQRLEEEREVYLARIAELQSTFAALRGSVGIVDLSKENELLRIEISKHKALAQSIFEVAEQVPVITPEEQYRLLKSGMDSGTNHVLGLAYSSASDSSWKLARNQFRVEMNQVESRYQYLPLGSDHKTAKRVNLRFDLRFPYSAAVVRDTLWRSQTDPEVAKRFCNVKSKLDGLSRQVEVFFPEQIRELVASTPGDEMSCMRYLESGKNRQSGSYRSRQMKFLHSQSSAVIYPQELLIGQLRNAIEEPSQTAYVVSSISAESLFSEAKVSFPVVNGKEAKTVSGSYYGGSVIQSCGDDSCIMTCIISLSLEDQLFRGYFIPDGDIVSADGKLNDALVRSLQGYWHLLCDNAPDAMKSKGAKV